MTRYERIISELPDSLSEEQQEVMLTSLTSFFTNLPIDINYMMLFAPYEKTEHYFTVFKLHNERENTAEKIIEFVSKHLGTIQSFENVDDHFDFYVDKKMYSLFDFTWGIVDLR